MSVLLGGQHGCHFGSSKIPSTNGQEGFQLRVLLLQVVESLIPKRQSMSDFVKMSFGIRRRSKGGASHSNHPFFALVIPLIGLEAVAAHGGESVDQVGAQGNVNILGVEFTLVGAVLSPVGVVTHTVVFTIFSWKGITKFAMKFVRLLRFKLDHMVDGEYHQPWASVCPARHASAATNPTMAIIVPEKWKFSSMKNFSLMKELPECI